MQKKSEKELPSVYANGSATRPTLDQAVQTAISQAVERLTTKLLPYAKKSKLTPKYLTACIKNEIAKTEQKPVTNLVGPLRQKLLSAVLR